MSTDANVFLNQDAFDDSELCQFPATASALRQLTTQPDDTTHPIVGSVQIGSDLIQVIITNQENIAKRIVRIEKGIEVFSFCFF